jgi:hypothetical protein
MSYPKQIIGLVGKKGAGKDASASVLVSKCGFRPLAFADPLREVVQKLFFLSPEHLDGPGKESPGPLGVSYRRGMQVVGTDFVRKQMKDLIPEMAVQDGEFWVEHARRTLMQMADEGVQRVVFTDVRFPNEARAIVEMGGQLVHVVPSPERLAAFYTKNGWVPEDTHASETGVDDILCQFDCTKLDNSGSLESLEGEVLKIFRGP